MRFDTVYFCGENVFKRLSVRPETTDEGLLSRHLDDLQLADTVLRVTENSIRFLKSRHADGMTKDVVAIKADLLRSILIGFAVAIHTSPPQTKEKLTEAVDNLIESVF